MTELQKRSAPQSDHRKPEPQERLYTYAVSDRSLEHGASLGNAHAWVASKGTGDIESLFCTDLGLEVTGALVVNYFASYHDLLESAVDDQADTGHSQETIVRLSHLEEGSFTLHPAYQRHNYRLVGDLVVNSTFFVPNTGADDQAIALRMIEIDNQSQMDHELIVVGCLYLPGKTEQDVRTRYDSGLGAFIAWNESHPDWVRAFGAIPAPDGYLVTHDVEQAWRPSHPLSGDADAEGDVTASLQVRLSLSPGDKRRLAFVVAFTPQGQECASGIYRGVTPYEDLYDRTVAHYREVLLTADVTTPDDLINQGTQWCKANMLRVLADYPTGKAFTNDPGKSSHVVARDSAWFVYGADYILPEASCDLLNSFADRQEASGMMIEYYDALTDEREDFGLNINDDTPLFILAVVHHFDVTNHGGCADRLYSAVQRAADYIISQEDERGLIYCSADGTGAHGIAGWRNIIPDKSINGAVTEVNAESYAALCAAARFAGKLGDRERSDYLGSKAQELRDAIRKHLRNPQNGMYYLNIDTKGHPGTEVTADEVFPMIFGVADEESRRMIRLRLSSSDFMTDAGLRTVSSLSPFYTPDSLSGMLGGVWPGVTWWYAMASTDDDPDLMADALKRSYKQYVVLPPTYNTVPGQFSEWFDGQSLVNRGMRLSPWEPPRFLWAVIEGAVGLDVSTDEARIAPNIPFDWKWLRVRNLRLAQGVVGLFAARIGAELVFYTASSFVKAGKLEVYDEELTPLLIPISPNMVASAFASKSRVALCIANTAADREAAPIHIDQLLDADTEYTVSLCRSESGRWVDLGRRREKELYSLTVDIEAHGFALFAFGTH